MLELSMAATSPDKTPTITLESLDNLVNLHA